MKKLLVICLFALIISGAYTIAKENDSPYVNASSTVTREINPNYAQINIAVNTKAKSANDATRQNAEISSAVIKNLKLLLDTKRGDSIETINFNVSPQYTYKDGKSNLTGYSVSNTVKVKTRDLKSVSSIIDEAMKLGANKVAGLEFGYDEESFICNELYAQAAKNAYSQAQSVARALGSEVIGARSINTSCFIEGNSSSVRFYKSNAMGTSTDLAAMESTPIESKTLKVRATIDGTFNIK